MSDKVLTTNTTSTDVLIVGAGLAGLIAARQLVKENISVQVLEARNRIGGRVFDYQSKLGHIFPLGAGWLGPYEERLSALLTELGLETVPQYESGQVIMRLLGEQRVFDNTENIRVGPLSLPADTIPDDFQAAVEELDALSEQLPLEVSFDFPQARAWDSMTVETWSQQVIKTKLGRTLFAIITKEETGTELNQLSFLYYLFMWRSIIRRLVDDRTIKGGPQQICHHLANELTECLHLENPVYAIEQYDSKVVVYSKTGKFEGRYVIVAIPPNLTKKINYKPALPKARHQLAKQMKMGEIIKCILIYQTPFWREAGLSGMMVTDEGPLESTFDCSPEDGSCGALVGFIMGHQAREWSQSSPQARQEAVLEQLIGFFGPRAAKPLEYIDMDWIQENWTGGAYYAFMPPGVMSAYGQALREPVGCIHWAGTETAVHWNGSMEGAIRSGERAATEVLARIRTEN